MTQIVVNSNAYSDDGSSSRDMRSGGFRQWLLPMLGDVMLQTSSDAASAEDAKAATEEIKDQAELAASQAAESALAASQALSTVLETGSGWSPVFHIAVDSDRYVLQIVDWTGGLQAKPVTGYLSDSGLVANIEDGLNIRGAVHYSDLLGNPTLGTAAALNVPTQAGAVATPEEVVRGDDPRLIDANSRGSLVISSSQQISKNMFGSARFLCLEMVGGGESGSARVAEGSLSGAYGATSGGRGAPLLTRIVSIAELPDLIDVVIGSGGAPSSASRNATGSSGATAESTKNIGGDSVFAASLVAPGGGKDIVDVPTGPGNMLRNPPHGAGTTNNNGLAGPTYDSAFFGTGAAAKTNAGAGVYENTLTGNAGPVPGSGGGSCLNFVPSGNAGKTATAISGAGAPGQVTLKWW